MKKPALETLAPVQPKRTLFGVSTKELKAVTGGGGVIIGAPKPPPDSVG